MTTHTPYSGEVKERVKLYHLFFFFCVFMAGYRESVSHPASVNNTGPKRKETKVQNTTKILFSELLLNKRLSLGRRDIIKKLFKTHSALRQIISYLQENTEMSKRNTIFLYTQPRWRAMKRKRHATNRPTFWHRYIFRFGVVRCGKVNPTDEEQYRMADGERYDIPGKL